MKRKGRSLELRNSATHTVFVCPYATRVLNETGLTYDRQSHSVEAEVVVDWHGRNCIVK